MKLCHLLQSKPTAGNIKGSANTHKLAPAMCRCRNPLEVASQLLVRNEICSAPGNLTFLLESDGKLSFSAVLPL